MAARNGFTLVETMVALLFLGVLASLVVTPMRNSLVREAVRGARMVTAAHVARARGAAASRGCPAVLHLNSGSNRIWVTSCALNQPNGVDTIGSVDDLMRRYEVDVSSSRDSVVFTPAGLMSSAGLLSVQLVRSEFQDSLAVSPVGRLLW